MATPQEDSKDEDGLAGLAVAGGDAASQEDSQFVSQDGAGSETIGYVWSKPLLNARPPSARGGHTMVYADGKLIIFGGHFFAGNDTFEYVNETWVLSLDDLTWHEVRCTGQPPAARYGHTANVVGSRMFVFGGKGENGQIFRDLFYLDLIEWTWVPVKAISNGPSSRMMHTSILVGTKIVLHGGWDGETPACLDDLWIFDTESYSWMQPRTAGFAPTGRYGHSLTLLPDGRIILFGGCQFDDDGIPKYLSDVRQLDTETMVWTRPSVAGEAPSGRYGHTCCLVDSNMVAMLGGWGSGGMQSPEHVRTPNAFSLAVLDCDAMEWITPACRSRKPVKHLYNHAASTGGGASVLVFGGCDGKQSVNQFIVVEF